MKQLRGSPMSLKEFVENLNDGKWIVSGGHLVCDIKSPKLRVIKASLLGEVLKIETDGRGFEVSSNHLTFFNWIVEISQMFIRRQQRKKIEGGGWHEVPVLEVALRLSHPSQIEIAQKAREEKDRLEKEERTCKTIEELANRRGRFVNSLNADFTNKKLVKIEVVDEWKLRLLFEDNSTIEIGSDLSECGFCTGGSAVVNGTALQGFCIPKYCL